METKSRCTGKILLCKSGQPYPVCGSFRRVFGHLGNGNGIAVYGTDRIPLGIAVQRHIAKERCGLGVGIRRNAGGAVHEMHVAEFQSDVFGLDADLADLLIFKTLHELLKVHPHRRIFIVNGSRTSHVQNAGKRQIVPAGSIGARLQMISVCRNVLPATVMIAIGMCGLAGILAVALGRRPELYTALVSHTVSRADCGCQNLKQKSDLLVFHARGVHIEHKAGGTTPRCAVYPLGSPCLRITCLDRIKAVFHIGVAFGFRTRPVPICKRNNTGNGIAVRQSSGSGGGVAGIKRRHGERKHRDQSHKHEYRKNNG